MLDVGDGQPVVESSERIPVGDLARVAIRVEEPEPDRKLAEEVEEPVRENPDSGSRGDTGHGYAF